VGKLFIRLASRFPESKDNVTLDRDVETHDGLFNNVFQSEVPLLGKLCIRLASRFPENEDNDTLDCAVETHDGVFASVFQSAAPPLGRLFFSTSV